MKRRYFLLVIVLAAAIALFGAYLVLTRNFKDTTPPVISVDEQILEISVEDEKDVLMTGITAMDDRDGDVTASLLVESIYGITEDHVTTVTYAAFDRAGNVSKIQRKVRYSDYREPRFELTDSLCFPFNSGFDLLDYVGANDVLEGDIRRRVRATLVSDTRSINEIGSHIVRLQVTNSLGDTVEMDFPVEVYDPEWYTASVKLEEYLIYLKQGEVFNPEDYLKAFVVRGEDTDISRRIPNDILCDINSNVNTRVPGVYRVKYTLTQNFNLTTFSGQAILVVIVQE
ncbi:MAG: hypothetical protein IJA49_02590 [Oscillospiraceae bacterium]|nr:hypothetical protein [Oscillospiraceae bacterium]